MKSKACFPWRSLFGLWGGRRRARSPPLLETEQTARRAARWKPLLADGIHRFGVTWSAPRGKASTRRWTAGLTATRLVFPAAALVCGLGFEVTALCRSTFRWEHRSTSWALWGDGEREKIISDEVWLSEVKQFWLGALWGKRSPSWDRELEGGSERCLLIWPPVWAEVPAGKPQSQVPVQYQLPNIFYGVASGCFLPMVPSCRGPLVLLGASMELPALRASRGVCPCLLIV